MEEAGIRVWLDEQELEIGDSLSEKIDEGLSRSRYGIVILSPAFFAKHWPKKELAGLRTLEEGGRKVILPIWHNVDKPTVAKFSPPLADSFAARSDQDMFALVGMIGTVVFQKRRGSSSEESPSAARRFVEILESTPTKAAVLNFLKQHFSAIGYLGWKGDFTLAPYQLGIVVFDGHANYAGHGLELTLVSFTEVWQDPFETKDEPSKPKISQHITDTLSEINSLQREYPTSAPMQHQVRESLIAGSEDRHYWNQCVPDLSFFLFAGRRRWIDASQDKHDAWSELLENNKDVEIRSYDHIVDRLRESRR